MKILAAIILALVVGGLAYCGIGAAAQNSLSATLAVPASIAPNSRDTVKVTATYGRALTGAVTLKVLIYEDDITGNELLSSTGRIRIQNGGTTGEVDIVLAMSDGCEIVGTSGSGNSEDEHEIFLELQLIGTPPLNTDSSFESSNHDIECGESDE